MPRKKNRAAATFEYTQEAEAAKRTDHLFDLVAAVGPIHIPTSARFTNSRVENPERPVRGPEAV